MLIDLAMSE